MSNTTNQSPAWSLQMRCVVHGVHPPATRGGKWSNTPEKLHSAATSNLDAIRQTKDTERRRHQRRIYGQGVSSSLFVHHWCFADSSLLVFHRVATPVDSMRLTAEEQARLPNSENRETAS